MLKQITIISGKEGTGKTTLVASFAALADNKVIADCDVDAPDLHLLLHPEIIEKEEFKGVKVAVMDKTLCTECGICEETCRFNAIALTEESGYTVNPARCEGCGACVFTCPQEALTLKERVSGYAFISKTNYGPMAHAQLNVAEEASGKLVTVVRNNAQQVAEKESCELILIDGAPGIGCPVIASLTGVDLALVVTEPTMSGLHDLRHDRHTVSLLTDHLVFSPKYRGKVLEGEVVEAAEEIIKETCKELDIEVIDLAVNVDHVHLFIKYPPKYSVSWIAKRIKGRSSKLLRDRFSHLKEWCPDHLWAPSCYHGSVGHGWEVVEKYISGQRGYCYGKMDDAIPVVVIDEEKQEAHKTGYITLYTKLFKEVVCTSQK